MAYPKIDARIVSHYSSEMNVGYIYSITQSVYDPYNNLLQKNIHNPLVPSDINGKNYLWIISSQIMSQE